VTALHREIIGFTYEDASCPWDWRGVMLASSRWALLVMSNLEMVIDEQVVNTQFRVSRNTLLVMLIAVKQSRRRHPGGEASTGVDPATGRRMTGRAPRRRWVLW